jgi:hypothetical protein
MTVYVRHRTAELEKLCKLLGMLGSDHPGERDNAACRAVALLKSIGLTWEDVILPSQGLIPASKPTNSLTRKIAILQSNSHLLNAWEKKFLGNIRHFRRLSPKQMATIDKLVAKVMQERRAA